MMENIVLDTNCLIISLSRESMYYPVWRDFFAGKYTLCYSNEILAEYEEILSRKMGAEIANNIIMAILTRKNTRRVDVFFHFNLIKSDVDDNKFVDCAIVANAKYIVTQDHHFDVLHTIDFPKVDVIRVERFLELLTENSL